MTTEILYKYHGPSDRAISMLKRGVVWLAQPSSFNDPLDCKATMLGKVAGPVGAEFMKTSRVAVSMIMLKRGIADGTHPFGLGRKVAKYWLKEFERAHTIDGKYNVFEKLYRSLPISFPLIDPAKLVNDVEHALEQIGVLSLSARCDHMLMWAHYTNSHRGFCLGFERNPSSVLDDERVCRPVRYVSEFPRLDLDSVRITRTIAPGFRGGSAETAIDLSDANLQNVVFSKSEDWSYEQEWRVITSKGGIEAPFPGPLREVIFGLRCDASQRNAIQDAVRQCAGGMSVVFREVTTQPDSHVLVLREVT
ncbi:MAG: DUF2971 domain-containing protein [Candidatus Geothermincolia bacterium]